MSDAQTKVPTWAQRKPLTLEQVKEKLALQAEAAYSIAKLTTGDVDVRAGMMDKCHTLREALRLLNS